jgi:hypothetical protein
VTVENGTFPIFFFPILTNFLCGITCIFPKYHHPKMKKASSCIADIFAGPPPHSSIMAGSVVLAKRLAEHQ